jgi:hypothetical protein
MTKEEFKEMFEECFSLVVELKSDGYLHVAIADRDLQSVYGYNSSKAFIFEDYAMVQEGK